MTVASAVSRTELYTGNGVTTDFPFGFKVFAASELRVVERDLDGVETVLALGDDYTVPAAGIDQAAGGTVVLGDPLTDGHRLLIRRVVPQVQSTNLKNQGQTFPESVERQMDRLTFMIHDLEDRLARAVRLRETDAESASTVLPAPEASKVIQWNPDADGLRNLDPGSAALQIPAEDSVTTTKILDGAVTTPKIADGAATYDKMPLLTQGSLIGRAPGAGTGVPQALTSDQVGQIAGVSVNRIINGDFGLWQRQVPGTKTERADDTYCADRWIALSSANPLDARRIAGDTQRYAGELTQKNATEQRYGWLQIIENAHVHDLRSGQVTLKLRLNSAAGINRTRIAVLEWTGTADAVTSDPVATWSAIPTLVANWNTLGSTFVLSDGVWTDVTLTVTLSENANNLAVFVHTESEEFQNHTIALEAVQLVRGSSAPTFQPRAPAHELVLCQRYYEKLQENAPGSAAGSVLDIISPSISTVVIGGTVRFSTRKRTNPTVTPLSPTTGAGGKIRNGDTTADIDAEAVQIGPHGCTIRPTSAVGAATRLQLVWTAEAEL